MTTIAQALSADAARIKENIRILFVEHSRLSRQPEWHGSFRIIDATGDHRWEKLSVDARRLQAKVLNDYGTYWDLVGSLIRGLTGESQRQCSDANELIRRLVGQESSTYCKTTDAATAKVLAAFGEIEEIIDQLYSTDGGFLIVPDTNALIENPDLGEWRFDECTIFEMVFVPTVLAELDELKIAHKNPDVRAKAESVIRRIKDLARRGDLHAGVPVVKNRINARAIAVEPKLSDSLHWLDPTNQDDRFLASVIEVIRENTRSTVTIVTGDVNLQNKARFARIPFSEPPPRDIGKPQ